MQKARIGVIVALGVLVAAPRSDAQVRSFTTPERRPEQRVSIPRAYLPPKDSGRTTDYAHKMAVQLLVVARMHLGYDEARLKPLQAIADRIKPKTGRCMGERNRVRLHQFNDPKVVQRISKLLKRGASARARIGSAVADSAGNYQFEFTRVRISR